MENLLKTKKSDVKYSNKRNLGSCNKFILALNMLYVKIESQHSLWTFMYDCFTMFITSGTLLYQKTYVTAFNYREHGQVVI